MGIFDSRPTRRAHRFQPADRDDGKRVHFRNLSPYKRDRGRSLLFLVAMIAFILYLLYYLDHVKG